jgi:hypothetical protein
VANISKSGANICAFQGHVQMLRQKKIWQIKKQAERFGRALQKALPLQPFSKKR